MNRYRVWCPHSATLPVEYIFTETAWGARQSYARKHGLSYLDVVAIMENR